MNFQSIKHAFHGFDVNNVDLQTAGSWPVGIKAIFYVLVFTITVGIGGYFLIKDKHAAILKEVQTEVQLRNEFEEKSFQVRNLVELRQQLLQIEERFSEVLKQLPSKQEVPNLLENISAIAQQAGLSIENLELLPEAQSEFYIELPIRIRIQGTYHQMGEFVSGIGQIERIVTLHDYEVNSVTDNNLVMTLNAKTYRYEDE